LEKRLIEAVRRDDDFVQRDGIAGVLGDGDMGSGHSEAESPDKGT
jgi:hypothetical protein